MRCRPPSTVSTSPVMYDASSDSRNAINAPICMVPSEIRFPPNQIAATLPSQANAIELSKRLLEYVASTDAELNTVVLSALQFEAKKIL